jgi:5-methylcytosine-specific restriction endonuclease McrA
MANVVYAGDGGVFKVCTKCDEAKRPADFRPAAKGKLGVRADCRKCELASHKDWRAENPEYDSLWQTDNSDSVKAASAKWRQCNPEKAKAVYRKWLSKNKPAESLRGKEYRKANAETRREKQFLAYLENPEKRREIVRRSSAKRRSTPRGKIDATMSRGIHEGLTRGLKAGRSWESLVGYDLDGLTSHLEKKFLPGMSWSNYGQYGWHIDHIIPKSAFNYTSPDHIDFKRAWALSNLQPLWWRDNLIKKDRLDGPFQPSLAL